MNIIFTIKNDQILLRADAHNYELCQMKNRTGKAGNIVTGWEAFKYFGSLQHALERILDMKVRASDATDLKQLRADLEAARSEIMAAWSTELKMLP